MEGSSLCQITVPPTRWHQYTKEAVCLALHWVLKAIFYALYMPNLFLGPLHAHGIPQRLPCRPL